jgi:Calcineurin-like phosphoesterase superfamily domain
MRTALISDLHLGSATGEDLLRDASMRRILLQEIEGADRVVLLGDAIELRDLPLAEALELSRPFFEDLGTVLAGREVVLVPGNHDHRLAEPLLERIALSRKGGLALEHRFRPAAGAAQRLARWLGEARLELAYPGVWLREDVYATHGHYVDLHLTLPRAECLGAAAVMRGTGQLPDPATPDGYERILRPVYGLTYGLAQSGALRRAGGATRVSERAWHFMSGDSAGRPIRRLAAAAAAKAAVPAGIWAINRLLGTRFDSDLSPRAISRGGIAAAAEMARRLRIGAAHVITGHTHRAGPRDGEQAWPLPGGGSLHNTGNWIFNAVLHPPRARPGPYWPGTVTWVDGDGPPRRVGLLEGWDVDGLGAIARGGRFRLAAIASHELG